MVGEHHRGTGPEGGEGRELVAHRGRGAWGQRPTGAGHQSGDVGQGTVVDVGQEPRRIVMTPDDEYALVLNRRSGDISVIRRLSLTVAKPFRRPTPIFTMIPVGEEPVAAAVVPWTA